MDRGGIATSTLRLTKFLVESGFEVHVFSRRVGTGSFPEGWASGANWHRVDPGDDAFVHAIETVDAASPFDLFHGFWLTYAHPCLLVAAKGNRPVIASIRGEDGVELQNGRSREVLTKASWITSVSRDSIGRAMAVADISGRWSFIPNSIDTDSSSHKRWQVSAGNRGVVGTVATFRPKKNIPLLIEAYSAVALGVRRKLLLVGDFAGPESPETERRVYEAIGRRSLCSEVTITGRIEHADVRRYLLSMRAFVISSDHEGLPNSILEAAAVGVPIISTAVDGIKDIATSGVDALLVQPGKAMALADAIHRVLSDENLARQISRGARSMASRLKPEVEGQAYVSLYGQLVSATK
jgi:glycosyltransferase involved in cell wall biosynthesis